MCGVDVASVAKSEWSSSASISLFPYFLLSFHERHTTQQRPGHSASQQTLSYHLATIHDEYGASIPAPHSIARAPRSNNLLSFLQRYNLVRGILPSSQWCGQELRSAEVSQRSWQGWGVRPIGRRIHLPRTLREIASLAEELGRPRYTRDLCTHHLRP